MRKDCLSVAVHFVFTSVPKSNVFAVPLIVLISPHKHDVLLLFYSWKHRERLRARLELFMLNFL